MDDSLPAALTIAGSDSGAAAGIQADLLTFAACGVYGTTALTALTAQNPLGISALQPVPPAFLRAQIDRVLAYYPVRALKTGMLATAGNVDTVAEILTENPNLPAVIDPVMVATSGALLLDPAAIAALTQRLLPRAALITPNFDEAAVLLGRRPDITPAALETAALALAQAFGVPVLLKGGHVPTDPVLDLLAGPDKILLRLRAPRIQNVDTHGGGCTLSAAIAAQLALGRGLVEAVEHAHAGLARAFAHPLLLNGRKFLNHAALRD
ncbi:MAG: bifunctional hydroxymethylpyrimidine kinase/phosphomethylpyrimidine kinase [Opitutales bacterium]